MGAKSDFSFLLFSVDVNIMSGLKLLFLPGPEKKKNRVLFFFSSLENCYVSFRVMPNIWAAFYFLRRSICRVFSFGEWFLSLYLYIFISGLLVETLNLLTPVSNSESMATVFGLATHG